MKLVGCQGSTAGGVMPALRPASMQCVAQGTHDLQALGILHGFFRIVAVDGVPVLGGDHGHAGDGEILVEAVEGSAGPAATTAHHSGRGLEGVGGGLHVEHAVQQGAQTGIGPGIVDGRAHHQTVGLTHAFDAFVDRIVLEDAQAGPGTFAAGDTAADGLVAHVKRGGLDTGLFQLLGHSGQGRGRAALGMGTAVDEQDLHGDTPWLKTPGRRRAGTLQIRTARRE